MTMHEEPWQADWNELSARCERSAALGELALRRATTESVQSRLTSWRRGRLLEQFVGVLALVATGAIVAEHVGEVRYLVAGAALAAFCIAVVIAAIRLQVQAAEVDLAGPIASSQRALECLHLAEFRTARLWLLGGVVVWLPALLLGFEAVTGAPVLPQVDFAWFAANLGFGVVALVVGRAWSRRVVAPERCHPWAGRLVELLTGQPLQVARQRLRELAEFLAEPTSRR
jgi:hypothetical protein